MSTFELGTLKAPAIAFGAGSANYMSPDKAAQDMLMAIKEGVTHLDNAETYETENAIGKMLKSCGKKREELFICSKFGPHKGAITEARKPLTKTLSDIDYVDLYLIHDPVGPQKGGTTISKVWAELQQLKQEGTIKEIGVSNFRPEHLEELLAEAKEPPVINQIELHPYVYAKTKHVLDYCKSKGIKIAAYGAQMPLTQSTGGPVDAIVERIAKERGITTGQVLQRWAMQAGADELVTVTTKPQRVQEALAVPKLSPLSQAEFDEIAEAGSKRYHRGFMTHLEHFDP